MKTLAELQAIRDKVKGSVATRADHEGNIKVVVGMATCGIAAGARPVLAAFTGIRTRTGEGYICKDEPREGCKRCSKSYSKRKRCNRLRYR